MCSDPAIIPQVTSGKNAGKSKMDLDKENPAEQQEIKSHGECRIYLIKAKVLLKKQLQGINHLFPYLCIDHNSSNTVAQGHKPGRWLKFIKLCVFQLLLVIISVMPGITPYYHPKFLLYQFPKPINVESTFCIFVDEYTFRFKSDKEAKREQRDACVVSSAHEQTT